MSAKKLVAVITGGNSGIGAAAARKLAQNHFALSLAGRNQQRLQHVADECAHIAKSDKAVLTTSGDMTDDSHVESLVRRTLDKFGRIDVLVNNAGNVFESLVEPNPRVDINAYDKTFKLNILPSLVLTDLCQEHLFKSKGNVVNISSAGGSVPTDTTIGYAMSKAALDMYTKSLALKYAPKGVRVNGICPAAVDTPIIDIPALKSEAGQKMMIAAHPIGRIGEPHEVAELIAFLADNKKAGFITGALHFIDGGAVINNAFSAMANMMNAAGQI